MLSINPYFASRLPAIPRFSGQRGEDTSVVDGFRRRIGGEKPRWFERRPTEHEIDGLVKSILALQNGEPLKLKDGRIIKEGDLRQFFDAGEIPPLEADYVYTYLYPDETEPAVFRARKDEAHPIENVATYLRKQLGNKVPQEGLPLVLIKSAPKQGELLSASLSDILIPAYQVDGLIPIVGKDQARDEMHVVETSLYPVFEALISGSALPQSDVFDQLAASKLYQVASGDPQTRHRLQEFIQTQFEPLQQRLMGVSLANQHYAENVDTREVFASLGKGATVGALGEIAVHTMLPEGGFTAGLLRSIILFGVDLVDNYYGEKGMLEADLASNNISGKPFLKQAYGVKSWREAFRNRFKMQGEAGIFYRRAARSAAGGAMFDIVMTTPVGFALSYDTDLSTRAALGGLATVGTAMSIPLNVRATLKQIYITTLKLIQEAKIPLPEHVSVGDEEGIRHYALNLSKMEMLSRLGFSSSMKAFSLTFPTGGAMLATEALPFIPREVAQTLFMALGPASENLLRLIITMNDVYRRLPRKHWEMLDLVTTHDPTQPFDTAAMNKLRGLFVDSWSSRVFKLLTAHTRLPQLIEGVA